MGQRRAIVEAGQPNREGTDGTRFCRREREGGGRVSIRTFGCQSSLRLKRGGPIVQGRMLRTWVPHFGWASSLVHSPMSFMPDGTLVLERCSDHGRLVQWKRVGIVVR